MWFSVISLLVFVFCLRRNATMRFQGGRDSDITFAGDHEWVTQY